MFSCGPLLARFPLMQNRYARPLWMSLKPSLPPLFRCATTSAAAAAFQYLSEHSSHATTDRRLSSDFIPTSLRASVCTAKWMDSVNNPESVVREAPLYDVQTGWGGKIYQMERFTYREVELICGKGWRPKFGFNHVFPLKSVFASESDLVELVAPYFCST